MDLHPFCLAQIGMRNYWGSMVVYSMAFIMEKIKGFFLNEKAIMLVIIINVVVIFLQECGLESRAMYLVDALCTLIFVVEMVVKHCEYGVRGYWRSGWNIMDGVLVILSLPSLLVVFAPGLLHSVSFLKVLRTLRVIRFFRLVHVFPDFEKLARNFVLALKESMGFILGMLVIIVVFSMVGCELFRDATPEYFGTPLDGIYTTFRLFTGEGWNEIPDAIAAVKGTAWGYVIKLYFSLLLFGLCIIGMSLINSIFVDAMVSDNNDDVKKQLNEMERKLDELLKRR